MVKTFDYIYFYFFGINDDNNADDEADGEVDDEGGAEAEGEEATLFLVYIINLTIFIIRYKNKKHTNTICEIGLPQGISDLPLIVQNVISLLKNSMIISPRQ